MSIISIKRSIARRFWTKRGLGMKPNPIDERDYLYKYNDDDGVYPDFFSLEKYSEIVDQLNTGSCVGNAVAGAIRILENRKSGSTEYGYPSRLFLYWISRSQHETEPFRDNGTYVRACCKALSKYGVPNEVVWKFKKGNVNKKPIFNTWMVADPRRNGEYLAIFEVEKNSRLKAIMSALCEGYPVVFGTNVVDSFMPAIGPDIITCPSYSENVVGGHAMVIIGYRKSSTDRLQFRVMNSWGKYWRDNGYCWFDEDYIAWSNSRDFTIIRGWERLK